MVFHKNLDFQRPLSEFTWIQSPSKTEISVEDASDLV